MTVWLRSSPSEGCPYLAYNYANIPRRISYKEVWFFFKKIGQPWPLFRLFLVFQTIGAIFITNQCAKMSCPSSIWCWDWNTWPLEHESSPITTRQDFLGSMILYIWSYLIKLLWQILITAKIIKLKKSWSDAWTCTKIQNDAFVKYTAKLFIAVKTAYSFLFTFGW